MRLETESLARIKTMIHAVQAFIIFLAVMISIAVFTRPGSSDGRNKWFFGLCFLSIPILIYLGMASRFARARRFANVYAFATLDGLSVFLWLSAWASVASWVNSGKGKGKNTKASGCDNFSLGSPGKCKLSEANIAFGVIIMLLFAVTSIISFRSVAHYRRPDIIPKQTDFSAQTQDDFSSNLRHDEFDEEAELDPRQGGGRAGYQQPRESMDDEYAPIHQADSEDISQAQPTQTGGPLNQNPTRYSPGPDYDTSYSGGYGRQSPKPPSPQPAGYGRGAPRPPYDR